MHEVREGALMKNIDVLKLTVKADIVQADGIDGFGCYLQGSVKDKRCIIGLNIEALMGLVDAKELKVEDVPYVLAETVMHEVIHSLEDWAKVEFSHKKVDKLIEEYRRHYRGGERSKRGKKGRGKK